MRLALSSAAAPTASLGELLDACARRGLHALELEAGHGHGLDGFAGGPDTAAEARARAADLGVRIAGLRLTTPPQSPADLSTLAAFARALDAPLLVPIGCSDLLERLTAEGAPVLPVLATHWEVPALPAAGPLAWDADPAVADLSRPGRALLEAAGPRLRHIRLMGGGPEATEQEGRGVGALMARLALSGYDGTVALAPSSDRYRVIWDAWLGRRGGWGCGSHDEDRSLVSLAEGRAG